ncbi:hypothetical protein [Fusobacterium hominis]|uniref:Uncharacterized protein n=1 Tax=Fusobacterium hominis TaxID=2764326 RepID=A0A7G9GXH9_9FUSO|nr:hypothetical protein [Fusobacterium hominis]QNM15511.1 hypothetical protein H9Q81_01330 [Fusobacterium hominis]
MKYKVKVNEGYRIFNGGKEYTDGQEFIYDGDVSDTECFTVLEAIEEEVVEDETLEEVIEEETPEEEAPVEEIVEEKKGKAKGKGEKKETIRKPVPPPQK